MKICKRCFYNEFHPLTILIDDQGLCSGCKVHEEKDVIDWSLKWKELEELTRQYKCMSGNNYDCIIPVSGARDHFFIVDTVKNKLKMNPLLVTYNKQYNTDIGIRNLANLRTKFNCDIFTHSVSPKKLKNITRQTIKDLGSIYWHCIAGQTAFPVQIATKLKIPLIIWGAHQGLDQVGMFGHHHKVEMTRKYRREHDLMGMEAEDFLKNKEFVREEDLFPFFYPDSVDLQKVGVRGIYLNNYMRWDSKDQHEEMIKKYDYESDFQTRTFDNYNDVDCFNYSDVHDYIKYIKHGQSKIFDHVTREIRLKKITRIEGRAIIQQYWKRPPQNLKLFLDWIGITENSFHFLLDRHRRTEVWERDENFRWALKHDLLKDSDFSDEEFQKSIKSSCHFRKTPSRRSDYQESKYITIGKGMAEINV